jgi:hypothetical protein
MDPADLERDVDRALRALPEPVAPAALLARVMRNLDTAEETPTTRGWLRPWFAWRSGAQAAAAIAIFGAAATLVWFNSAIAARLHSLVATPQLDAARLVWRAVEPAMAGGAVYVLVMGVMAVCVAAALTQVALEGTSTQ